MPQHNSVHPKAQTEVAHRSVQTSMDVDENELNSTCHGPHSDISDRHAAQPAKRMRPAGAEDNALASRLSQDLIDEIVDCGADERDLFGLLRLRAVSSSWANAVQTVSRESWFCDWLADEEDVLEDHNMPHRRFIDLRLERTALRVKLILWRDCRYACVCLITRTDAATFEKLLEPITTVVSSAKSARRPSLPRSLLPLGPCITWLDLTGSAAEAVNNDTIAGLAELLPAVRRLRVRECGGVSDVNAFARHGLTELDISNQLFPGTHDKEVHTAGMAELCYVKKLRFSSGQPVCVDHIAGRLTELVIESRGFIKAFSTRDVHSMEVSGSEVEIPGLLSSPKYVLQRLTKLTIRGWFMLGELFDNTPTLTDLALDNLAIVPGEGDVNIPEDLQLRRLSLQRCRRHVHGLHNCGHTLTELDVSYCETIDNDDLLGLHALKTLNAVGSRISSLAPFVDTLTELHAGMFPPPPISDASLAGLRCLRKLDVSNNMLVTTIVPFADTLTELRADRLSGLAGADLGVAPCLQLLSARFHSCPIGDANLQSCTTLTELHCKENERITTIKPFIDTLERLVGEGNSVPDDEIDAVPRLTYWD